MLPPCISCTLRVRRRDSLRSLCSSGSVTRHRFWWSSVSKPSSENDDASRASAGPGRARHLWRSNKRPHSEGLLKHKGAIYDYYAQHLFLHLLYGSSLKCGVEKTDLQQQLKQTNRKQHYVKRKAAEPLKLTQPNYKNNSYYIIYSLF